MASHRTSRRAGLTLCLLAGLTLSTGLRPPAVTGLARSSSPSRAALVVSKAQTKLQTTASLNPRLLTSWLRDSDNITALLEVHEQYGAVFNSIHLATFWSTLGKLVRQQPVPPRKEWVDLTRKLGAARRQTQRLLDSPEQLDERSFANVAYGAARARVGSGGKWAALWEQLAGASLPRVGEFGPQAMSNTAWAYATSGYPAPALFDALANEAVGQLGDFTPQALSNMVWAFATAGHAHPALFDAVAVEAARRAGDVNPQNLANIAWSFAKMEHAAPALFEALAARALSPGFLRRGTPQALSNVLWAYATAGHSDARLFDAMAVEVAPRISSFNAQELSNVGWGFATARHDAPALFDAVSAEAERRAATDLDPQAIGILAWALATAGYASPVAFDALARSAAPRLRQFSGQSLSNLAWACATAAHAAEQRELFCALGDEMATRLDERQEEVARYDPQVLANLGWAYACADHRHARLFGRGSRFAEACAACNHNTIGLLQLHQWELWRREVSLLGAPGATGAGAGAEAAAEAAAEAEAGANVAAAAASDMPALAAPLAARCLEAFVASDGNPSELQRQVVRELEALGLTPRQEVRTDEGYSLDATVVWRGQRVGVEVDGPFHFLRDSRQPDGATTLKRRQLRRFGWRLLSVTYWEWSECNAKQHQLQRTQRRDFLRKALDEVTADARAADADADADAEEPMAEPAVALDAAFWCLRVLEEEEEGRDELVEFVSHRLHEPQLRIARAVVELLGAPTALELLVQTEAIQRRGGMVVEETGTPRTSGGIYLKLLKEADNLPKDEQAAAVLRIKVEGTGTRGGKKHKKKKPSQAGEGA